MTSDYTDLVLKRLRELERKAMELAVEIRALDKDIDIDRRLRRS
jgi:hypothetical protein